MNKTTNRDFELFKKEAKKWIEYFGLKDWRVGFEHEEHEDGDYVLASCHYDVENVSASLTLSKKWEVEEVTKEAVRRAAFHEVCELLLCRTTAQLGEGISSSGVYQLVHPVIRRLENTIFEDSL